MKLCLRPKKNSQQGVFHCSKSCLKEILTLLHEDFFTLGGIFALAGFVVEEFYCTLSLIQYSFSSLAHKINLQKCRITALYHGGHLTESCICIYSITIQLNCSRMKPTLIQSKIKLQIQTHIIPPKQFAFFSEYNRRISNLDLFNSKNLRLV